MLYTVRRTTYTYINILVAATKFVLQTQNLEVTHSQFRWKFAFVDFSIVCLQGI